MTHLVSLVLSSLFCSFLYLPLLWRSPPVRSTTKDVILLPVCVCKHFLGFHILCGLSSGHALLGMLKKNAKYTTWGCGDHHHTKNAFNGENYGNSWDNPNLPRLLVLCQLHCTQLARKGCRSLWDSPTKHGAYPAMCSQTMVTRQMSRGVMSPWNFDLLQDGHPLLVKTHIYVRQLHKFVY